ncbi:UDP-N-acetylmuramoylalanine--D-glutamate ligase [Candidatus Hartigia pinicola]|nr:UDP-N-acetylmuramoylalanine--D-glutamate ligase [Candidatus Hartigia pinicola]
MTDYRSNQYQGKKIVIIGLGLTGLSCVYFFLSRGIIPRVMDTRSSPENLKKLPNNIQYYLGGLNREWLRESNLIVVSPSIALSTPELHQASINGTEIVGDIELFCREINVPVIAITGSNGKSMVTSLVSHMAKKSGISVGVGGNIGIPVLSLLHHKYQMYILELSSFQLETTFNLQALSATVLNVTEDHMDRYPLGLQQYREAKLRIYHNTLTCIINSQDLLTLPLNMSSKTCTSFGVDVGDYYFDTYQRVLMGKGEVLLDVASLNMTGQHNYTNALAALALADSAGIARNVSLHVLKNYSGLVHRFQLVLFNKGVKWINDSKATNVASTAAALNGLTVKGIVHLLLGGDSKSADFSPLKRYISADNIRLYCFGTDGQKLSLLQPNKSICTVTMEESMRQLVPYVKSGDIVLLSPACASIDQFKNFEQRGNVFTQLAKELGA